MNIFQQYNKSLVNYFSSNYFYAILGIVCGLTIDKIITHAKKILSKITNTLHFIWYFTIIFNVYGLLLLLNLVYLNGLLESWQSTTPGFVFVSMIFGTSYNLYSNIQLLI